MVKCWIQFANPFLLNSWPNDSDSGQLNRHRFDVIKYRDATVAGRPRAGANADLPDFLLGCIMLVFRVRHEHFGAEEFRDFVLIRRMKAPARTADGPFPRYECENRCRPPAGRSDGRGDSWLDDPEARNKLGRLWAWDDHNGAANYRVLSANNVIETVAIMPRFLENSPKWSIATGVYENRYLMDARARPPFVKRCPCLPPDDDT